MTKELERKIIELEQYIRNLTMRVSELEGEWKHLADKYNIDTDRIIAELVKLTGLPEYLFR
jgi:hypothetical protein